MQPNLFQKIMHDMCNYDPYFVQRRDAANVLGLFPEQKLTVALRMLAYGASADQVDEITRMGKSTVLESLKRFCHAVEAMYSAEYLCQPTPADLVRLLQKAEHRRFLGMIGSIDCMHWQWKSCPSAWHGDYQNRKGTRSIILEAVASYDTWIWHAFFRVPGSQNDFNVLGQSPVFSHVLRAISPQVTYEINETVYSGGYYLADGIYPTWTTFVKTIPHPQTEKERNFATRQDGYRKDVERCFGILQARWAIIRGTARLFDDEELQSIMMACIILHNMIVHDEYDYDELENFESDMMNNERTRIYLACDNNEEPAHHDPLQRDGRYNDRIIQRYTAMQSSYVHNRHQSDLIEHLWELKGARDE